MPPKEYNDCFQKIDLNGVLIYVEHMDDVYNVYNDQMNLIEQINAPLEGLSLINALNQIVSEMK